MQFNEPARVEMSAYRFELIIPWKQPVDNEWAMREFAAWLNNRLDLTRASVYDGGVQAKGTDHG